MLSSLSLNNVALFKKQTIDFSNGFNCLLGQSGAGKSIIIDALSFVLGSKADKNLLRSGEDILRVDACFENISTDAKQICEDLDIEIEGELIITRTLSRDGKSNIKINGYPATTKMLQTVTERLVDFCGQHDSVGLLNIKNHLLFLDKFAGEEAEKQKEKVLNCFDQVLNLQEKINSLGGDDLQRERTKDLLEFQIQELESANLKIGEQEELAQRLTFISSAEKIFEKVSDAILKLDKQSENACTLLYESKNALSSFGEFEEIENCRERLENAYYEVKDIVETLESIKQNSEFDPKELERLDARQDQIKSLSKKYGKTIEDMLTYLGDCKQKLDELENGQIIIEKLQKQLEEAQLQLANQSDLLSNIRKKYAQIFEKQIMAHLEDLEMKGTYFKVEFEKTEPTKKGQDVVKFMFSVNQGQEAKDLHKTASGGELSRLLLAFKNVMLDKEKSQTVVFDEIDAGISGHTAGKLADKLVAISKYTQIICITHTPVVASKANNFLLVEKKIVDNSTISTVKHLQNQEVVSEIAHLIDGGQNISQTALQHAENLLKENG